MVPYPTVASATKGDACVELAMTAKHGNPASVVVVMALPFACYGQTMTVSDLENFGEGAAQGMKQTFDLTDPVQTNYSLGSHTMWIERADGTPKNHAESSFTFEIACTVLEKGAVCWMTMAADAASLQAFEQGHGFAGRRNRDDAGSGKRISFRNPLRRKRGDAATMEARTRCMLCSKPAEISCRCAPAGSRNTRQPPNAGRVRVRSACARGSTCACCPPALDLASSAATSNPPPKILACIGPRGALQKLTISRDGIRGRAASDAE